MEDETIYYIIIPLLSALLGGTVGVFFTIVYESRQRKKAQKLAFKPWIYSSGKNVSFDSNSLNEIVFGNSNFEFADISSLYIYLHNTDNGICVLKRFQTESKAYYPNQNSIADKNSISRIQIVFEPGDTLKEMELYIEDVFGNLYIYDVEQVPDSDRILSIKEQAKKGKAQKTKKKKRK